MKESKPKKKVERPNTAFGLVRADIFDKPKTKIVFSYFKRGEKENRENSSSHHNKSVISHKQHL